MVKREDVGLVCSHYTVHAEGNCGRIRGNVLFGTNCHLDVLSKVHKKQKNLIPHFQAVEKVSIAFFILKKFNIGNT